MFRRTHHTAPMSPAEWQALETAKSAQIVAQHILAAAREQASQLAEVGGRLRCARERNHFGEALELAMQRKGQS